MGQHHIPLPMFGLFHKGAVSCRRSRASAITKYLYNHFFYPKAFHVLPWRLPPLDFLLNFRIFTPEIEMMVCPARIGLATT